MTLLVSCRTAPPPACSTGDRFAGVAPLATSTGGIRAIYATSDVPGRLEASTMLLIRVVLSARTRNDPHLVFIDADGDRTTGMWTQQSSISASGWDLQIDADGGLLTHAGPPTKWDWKPASASGYAYSK